MKTLDTIQNLSKIGKILRSRADSRYALYAEWCKGASASGDSDHLHSSGLSDSGTNCQRNPCGIFEL